LVTPDYIKSALKQFTALADNVTRQRIPCTGINNHN